MKSIWQEENGEKLKKEKKKYRLLIVDVLAPIKGSTWQWVTSLILGAFLSIPIGISTETVKIFSESVDIINGAFIAFIAMEMGAYALFQALLSDELIFELYRNGNLLEKSIDSFLGVILTFWIGIILNIFLMILFKVIPQDFLLFTKVKYNNLVAIIFLIIYYTLSMRILFEVRNFAINLYMAFVAYNKIVIREMKKKQ